MKMESQPNTVNVHHPLDTASPYFINRPTSASHDSQKSPNEAQRKQHRPQLIALRRNRNTDSTTTAEPHPENGDSLWHRLDGIEQHLNQQIERCVLPLLIDSVPIAKRPTKSLRPLATICAVYNPTVYARRLHRAYLQRFLTSAPSVVFVGMNPGPWGMCQTGVPFGSVPIVRDWMQLSAEPCDDEDATATPTPTAIYMVDPDGNAASGLLPPVSGLMCHRPEVSGQRFWSLMRSIYGDDPAAFARQCFVHNLCPLAFFDRRGRNVTPPELPSNVRAVLESLCSVALLDFVDLLLAAANAEPSPPPCIRLVCIGGYVERVLRRALKLRCQSAAGTVGVELLCMPHPSPRATGNGNWMEKAHEWMTRHGIKTPS